METFFRMTKQDLMESYKREESPEEAFGFKYILMIIWEVGRENGLGGGWREQGERTGTKHENVRRQTSHFW